MGDKKVMLDNRVIHQNYMELIAWIGDKKTAVFGTGKYADFIFNELKVCNVVGFVEPKRAGAYHRGKLIFDLKDLKIVGAEVLVIGARLQTCQQIYQELLQSCFLSGLTVYNVYGVNMEELNKKLLVQKMQYDSLNERQVKDQIKSHDIISFDIFDTLLARKVLFPADLFNLLGEKKKVKEYFGGNFGELRVQAEKKQRNRCPTLEEIYQYMGEIAGIEEKRWRAVFQEELELERQNIVSREGIVQLLEYARALNKEIFLISDMYMTKKQIVDILDKVGIRGYRALFVSCEYKTTKYQFLYGIFRERIQGKSFLHIGDNELTDVLAPMCYGMDAILLKSGLDMFRMKHEEVSLGMGMDWKEKEKTAAEIVAGYLDPFCVK